MGGIRCGEQPVSNKSRAIQRSIRYSVPANWECLGATEGQIQFYARAAKCLCAREQRFRVWAESMPLTEQQRTAIAHAGGNLQLIACAGSGKTEVVAQHITRLLTPKND